MPSTNHVPENYFFETLEDSNHNNIYAMQRKQMINVVVL